MKQEYDFSKGVRGRFYRDMAEFRLPKPSSHDRWEGPSGRLCKFIVGEAERSLNAYREQPRLVREHARSELDTAQGGYAHRQLYELVQNSADALLGADKEGRSVLVRLSKRFLYCADNGTPIDEDGVEGLMFDRMSNKRNTAAIGRFGRGFKSVLRVSDAPEFYSRSGSFRFDRERAVRRIAKVAPAESYPVLRLPEPLDSQQARTEDKELQELMQWANNIVRLPLKPRVYGDLAKQLAKFPPEFLLFVDHVQYLTLECEDGAREFTLEQQDGELRLDTGAGHARWCRFDETCEFSAEARADWHLHDEVDEVPISWAVPLDRLDRPGHFWAFFPTDTASLVAGILNAPWKTNEDRQNLLPGPYNEELIDEAARMVAEALPELATKDDPARHLDALPRRREAGDSKQADLLRERLFSNLRDAAVVPDQDGTARLIKDISYPPRELTNAGDTKALECWEAYSGRPRDWLHHLAMRRNRMAAINRLSPPRWDGDENQTVHQESIETWLEALAKGKQGEDARLASKAAIRTAVVSAFDVEACDLGRIVLTANGGLASPDSDRLFIDDGLLDDGNAQDRASCVHPKLVADTATLSRLKKLGLKPPSPDRAFRLAATQVVEGGEGVSDERHRRFWVAARRVPSTEAALDIIRKCNRWGEERWRSRLRIRTVAGSWVPLDSALFPGPIVSGEGNSDDAATVDMDFHDRDRDLLKRVGVTDAPHDGRDLSTEMCFSEYLDLSRERFKNRDLPKNPQTNPLKFKWTEGSGPLDVLSNLPGQARAAYTDALLSLDGTYPPWSMHHETQQHLYPDLPRESLTIRQLRKAGRVRTRNGAILPFADALGESPKSPEALHVLLRHPNADKIKEAFGLAAPTPVISGEGDATPLVDIWPGLRQYLTSRRRQCRLVPCERIRVIDQSRECVFLAPDVYLAGAVQNGSRSELQLVVDQLGLDLTAAQVDAVALRRTPTEIEERRSTVRQRSTDAERLLAAVGEVKLRRGLPDSLLAVLEQGGEPLSGVEIAEAAIATFHTDALRQYRWALDPLGPPVQWAGSAPAVRFVQSLGFPPDWAGERSSRLAPFLEIPGRYRLPDLHDYQNTIVGNLREMLCRGSGSPERRGMVSMPTGSGKTRVTVQAIVEAIRDGNFLGGVLWVADRGELCEQAVEAWRQVWSGIGPHEKHLRVSRMWAGQPRPLPVAEHHVVVATIQTLNARMTNGQDDYDFLRDFVLVVFDEAHRSIAPTFTTVMEEIGLTRRQGAEEPFLVGLTATPYRGYDEDETRWLANRYGGNRLDAGAFRSDDAEDVIQELQSTGVLAQADHEVIEGETFSLEEILGRLKDSHQELEKWKELPWLPQSVEDRIARSAKRTQRILEAFGEHIRPDWPTLIFATSVEHAKTLAALLNREGIRARSVSAETETRTRRRIVEEFRAGEIRALVNYGVFREGFDAPKTRAIIVARPVYSPNLYFQMIGRGLRGPLNGGDERCLILNVRDNIESFDRSLAFSELDWLWA